MGVKGSTDIFMHDIDSVIAKIREKIDIENLQKILTLRNEVEEMHRENRLRINHSVMEFVIADYLIETGFDTRLESKVNGILADVYAEKGLGTIIVEVETGFVPPDNALSPLLYLRARIASKIVRYSNFANKFVLATPPYFILQIPACLTKPPRFRTDEEIEAIKRLCDLYYSNPQVSLEEIRNARLHAIYVVDVDNVKVREWEVNEYIGKASLWST
jgi:hypothetical protein